MDVRHFINGKLQDAAPASPCAKITTNALHGGAEPAGCEARRVLATPLRNVLAREVDGKEKFEQLISSKRFVAFSLPNCPQCDDLDAFFASRGVPSDVFVKLNKSSPEYPELKAAIAAHAGEIFSFPQLFMDGAYQGGFEEVMKKAKAGAYDELFQDEFGVVPSTVRRVLDGQAMVVLSLTTCPQCDVLREKLDEIGLPVSNIFIKWDKAAPEYQSLKSQLIEITGFSQFSFPQTFVRGRHEGSFDDIMEKIDAGVFNEFFSDEFGVSSASVAPIVQPEAAVFDEDF